MTNLILLILMVLNLTPLKSEFMCYRFLLKQILHLIEQILKLEKTKLCRITGIAMS